MVYANLAVNKYINSKTKTPEIEDFILRNEFRKGHQFPETIMPMLDDLGKSVLAKQFNVDVSRIKDTFKIDAYWGRSKKMYYFSYKGNCFYIPRQSTDHPKNVLLLNNQKYDETKFSVNVKGWKPYNHQIEAVNFSINTKYAFLLDDQGLGKTDSSIISALCGGVDNVLVVTLSSLLINWKREIKKYGYDAHLLTTGKCKYDSNKKFNVVAYDTLKNIVKNKESFEDFYAKHIIFDECHKLKNPTSQRSKAASKVIDACNPKFLQGLSGTLIENNSDLYGVCKTMRINIDGILPEKSDYISSVQSERDFHIRYCNTSYIFNPALSKKAYQKHGGNSFVDKKETTLAQAKRYCLIFETIQRAKIPNNEKKPKASFANFQLFKRYCDSMLAKYSYIEYLIPTIPIYRTKDENTEKAIKNSNTLELASRSEFYMLRRMKTEVFKDFVKKHTYPVFFSLSKREENQYKKLYLELVEAANAENIPIDDYSRIATMAQGMTLRQFLSVSKVKQTYNFIKDLIEEGKNVLLFTNFQEEYETFQKYFGSEAVFMDSSYSNRKKQACIDEYMQTESKQVLIGNLIPLGTGHNITKADVVVFNSPSYVYKDQLQGEDRTWRLGRKEDVVIYNIVYEATVEEDVVTTRDAKKDNNNTFFEN